jgi:hypothetical protein
MEERQSLHPTFANPMRTHANHAAGKAENPAHMKVKATCNSIFKASPKLTNRLAAQHISW